MTVVVPAFNEEDRLVGMLEEAVNYLEHEYGILSDKANAAKKQNGAPIRRRASGQTEINGHFPETNETESARGWEILLIDDGSTDSTIETALTFARTHQLPLRPRRNSGPWSHRADSAVNIPPGSIRLVSLKQNRGKGGAVTHGMRHARGSYIVFADADGASKFDDLGSLVSACQKLEEKDRDNRPQVKGGGGEEGGRAVAVGSRAHLVGSEAVVKRSKLRNFLMHSFHLLLKCMTPPRTAAIRDTQCGFKLFTRSSLPYIIPYMHCEGWIFDVEMLMLAEFAGIPVGEEPCPRLRWVRVSLRRGGEGGVGSDEGRDGVGRRDEGLLAPGERGPGGRCGCGVSCGFSYPTKKSLCCTVQLVGSVESRGSAPLIHRTVPLFILVLLVSRMVYR